MKLYLSLQIKVETRMINIQRGRKNLKLIMRESQAVCRTILNLLLLLLLLLLLFYLILFHYYFLAFFISILVGNIF